MLVDGSPIRKDLFQTGTEVQFGPKTYTAWYNLRERMLREATLDPNKQSYIRWEKFNKPPNIDRDVTNDMAGVLADVFAPFKPTHVLGIMNSGIDLAWTVAGRFRDDPPLLYPCIKTESPGSEREGPIVSATSYTMGACYFALPNLEEGSRVLLIDDTAARGGASLPVIEGLLKQPGVSVAFGVGFDKEFQGWQALLNQRYPQVRAFSVVRVEAINPAVNSITLMHPHDALRII